MKFRLLITLSAVLILSAISRLNANPSHAGASDLVDPPSLEIIFLVDVSNSVIGKDNNSSDRMDSASAGGANDLFFDELEAQRKGIIEALTSPEIIQLVKSCSPSGIRVAYVEWAGSERTKQIDEVVPWSSLSQTAEFIAFTQKIKELRGRRFYGQTDIYSALDHARSMFLRLSETGATRLILLSGDGKQNVSPPGLPEDYSDHGQARAVEQLRDQIRNEGISIAAIAIDRRGPNTEYQSRAVSDYFEDHVVAGPYGFAESAADYRQYGDSLQAALYRLLNHCRW